ncbi:rhomboid family intramembrane serine protease [Chryseobacterium sp. JK1]|uniref:rhomboid family intramembrane serine protease n=1 Tax=Chryseobacterium sp. JK1 TaxID=874294 RepID=UPI003D6856E3
MGISIKKDIIEFWLPFGLPFVPILIWLRPRIKLFKFKRDDTSFFYQFLACMAIALPTIIAQQYLTTATGKLTRLNTISELSEKEQTAYYSLKHFYIDKKHLALQNTTSVEGRNNERINMLIYVAMPILEKASDTVKTPYRYWLGKRYSEDISMGLSNEEKMRKFKLFAEKSQKEFNATNFNTFSYLEVVGNTNDHDEYNNALKNIKQNPYVKNIIFEAKSGPFETRAGNKGLWILYSFGIGLFIYLIALVFPKFQEDKLKNFKNGQLEKNSDLKDMFEIFIPAEGFFITPIIINLNVLIYLIMVFSGLGWLSFKGEDLLNWGANYKPLTVSGQWWRLLTCMFLHGGLIHILTNMMGLMFVGIFIEPLLGRLKFTLIYLITGLIGSLASIAWYDGAIGVGASGAIFGLYGFFLACMLMKIFHPDFTKAFLFSTIIFMGVNLLMGVLGGIDNAAHIGGLVSGFIIGVIIAWLLKKRAVPAIENKEENTESNTDHLH